MPGSTKKALYLAKNLTELNVLASETIKVTEGKCRLYAKSSEKVYTNAEESELLGDEERAYVLYMKFLNIIQSLRKTAEYKKSKKYYDDLIGINKLNTALSQAEILSSSLKARYEEKEAIEVSEKLEKLGRDSESETKKEVVEEKLEEKEEHVKVAEVETPDQISEKKGLMLCDKLYKLMHDDSTSVVVMDVRPAEQFLASHINFSRCINIPRHIIYAGCTVKQLEDHVPEESREQWSRRGSVDFIVLLDWTSNDADLQPRSTITCLKDAIYKWDQETIVKSEPLILDGGYEEWLNMYPTLTTNASIPRPPSYSNFSSSAVSLETIDYDLELTFLKSAEELEAEKMKNQRNNMISTNQNVTPPLVQNNTPLIPDRKSKPVSNNMVIPTTVKSNENIERIKNDFSKPKGLSLSDLKKKLDIGGDSSQLPVKDINIKNDKPENKQSSEIINKPVPSVDRTLKPKATPSNNVEPEILEDVNSEVKPMGSTVQQVETEAQVDRLHEQQESKQRELESYRTESKRLALETEARRAKLSKEKEQFEKISEMKSKAQEETEELQKKKEAIENEIRNLEKEKTDRLAEEKHKLEEWKRAQKEEEEQKAKLKQLRELKRAEEARKKEDQLKKQQQVEKQKTKEAEEQAKEKALNETKAREAQLREAQLREAQLKEAQLREAQAKADREKMEREKKLQEDEQKNPAHPKRQACYQWAGRSVTTRPITSFTT